MDQTLHKYKAGNDSRIFIECYESEDGQSEHAQTEENRSVHNDYQSNLDTSLVSDSKVTVSD